VHNDSRKARATNRRIEIVCQRGSVRKHMVDVLQRNIDRSLRIYSPGIL
jgi:hypothetical protein